MTVVAPRFTEHPESQVIKHHGKAVLQCQVSPPTAYIYWTLNGTTLYTDQQNGLDITGGRLQIASFRHIQKGRLMSHEGVYQCVANNSAGVVVSRQATLQRACEFLKPTFFKAL